MKLRIKGNSIRLRLTRSEVKSFGELGKVSETIEFGEEENQKLVYSLLCLDNGGQVDVEFNDRQINILVPSDIAKDWVNTEKIGFSAKQQLSKGGDFSILVEKDFACLKPRDGEDESDNYPHPNAGEAC